jgi:hypothetical protein
MAWRVARPSIWRFLKALTAADPLAAHTQKNKDGLIDALYIFGIEMPDAVSSLFFGTVVILSTMSRERVSRPLRSFGAIGTRNNGASVGSVVMTQIVMDSVASKRSSCRMTAGRGLAA